jgi:hypothetical protein
LGERSKSVEFTDPVVFENVKLEMKDEERPELLCPSV